MKWIAALVAGGLVCCLGMRMAAAGETEERAQALFLEGRELMAKERYQEACEKFKESEALVSSGGTILNLGECNEKAGRLEEALPYFERAAELARQAGKTDIEAFALRRALEVREKLEAVRKQGEKPLQTEPQPNPVQTTQSEEGNKAEPKPPGSKESGESPQLWVGVGLGVAGAVTLVVGAAFGGLALSTNDEALEHCNGDLCSQTGLNLTYEAVDYAHASTVLLVGGGVLAGVGLIVALTAPMGKSTSAAQTMIFPWVDANVIGAAAWGTF